MTFSSPLIEDQEVIRTLHQSDVVRIEDLNCSGKAAPGGNGYSARFHLVLPRVGSFSYAQGARQVLAGPNHILTIPEDCEYRVGHPAGGDRSLALFPRASHADEMRTLVGAPRRETGFRKATAATQILARRLVWAAYACTDPLAVDELAIALCKAVGETAEIEAIGAKSERPRTIDRAKEFLHAHARAPIRLGDVAAASGVSPIYLTDLFRRIVGVPMHQYLLQLRLAEALDEIPAAEDLTALALDVGFSSHSHFTAAFRARFGQTPSKLRSEAQEVTLSGSALRKPVPVRPLCAARGGIRPSAATA